MLFKTNKKYGVIYADPPWTFKTYSNKGKDKSPEKHYSCMSLSDIISLPVGDLAKDDAVLLMWVVDPLLDQAFKVIDAWGFKYKTVGFTWAKTNRTKMGFFTGLGYWTRGNPEMCLLATKGKPKRISKSVPQLVVSERREHSRKPDIMYNHVENLLQGPYVELFARNKRPGWDSWGNQTDKFI
jgi:N6-adenosine-specific RNA methylase IME4